jgi:hypothetical protein
LLDSIADFSELNTAAGLCLKSCYEETQIPSKETFNKSRNDEKNDPKIEVESHD